MRWALSAALSVWLPGMRAGRSARAAGCRLALALGALATSLAGWQRISAWTAETASGQRRGAVQASAVAAAPWLLIGALALTAASLLTAL